MIEFTYRGHRFEDHGPECPCDSCTKTDWDKYERRQRSVVYMRNDDGGYYQVYSPTGTGPYFTKEQAAEVIVRKYLGGSLDS